MNSLNDYNVIVMVAENGSFSAVANMLNTVPSNISRIVSRQEERLGFLIFERKNNNRLIITDKGKLFISHAKEMIEKENKFYLDNVIADSNDVMNVGLSYFFSNHLADLHFHQFEEYHKNIKFNVYTRKSSELMQMLNYGLIDIAVVQSDNTNIIQDKYKINYRFDLDAHFYTAEKQYKNIINVEPDDKIFKRMVLPNHDSPVSFLVDMFFSQKNITVNPLIVTDNIPIIFNSILNGNCTGVLYDSVVKNEHLEDQLFPVRTSRFKFSMPMYFIANNSNIAKEYVDFITELYNNDLSHILTF